MTYDELTSALRYTNSPKLGMMLATVWVVLWRAWQMTLSAPLRLARYLRTVKRYTWFEYFLTILWWGFAAAAGLGLGNLLNGNPTFLLIVVLIWTVPCMLWYVPANWWDIDDFEEDD